MAWIGRWAEPTTKVFEQTSPLGMPVMSWHALERLDALAAAPPSNGVDRHWLKRWAELGCAYLRRRALRECAHQSNGIDIACLALVGGHAHGGVALKVFNRAKILLRRQCHVAGRDIVLQIDEDLSGRLTQS